MQLKRFAKNKNLFLWLLILISGLTSAIASGTPQYKRERGLSVYLTPDNVVKQGSTPKIQRFIVSATKGQSIACAFDDAQTLVAYYEALPIIIQHNGLWLVTTDPDSYTAKDKQQLSALEKFARKKHIPYFTCRGKDLPNGWKQVN